MKKFLAGGIDHFNRPGNDLNGCVPDALAMMGVAKSLQVMDGIVVLEDQEVVKSNVMNRLGIMVKEAQLGTLTYLGFSWSGHGTHYDRPEEPDGLGEALCCCDIDELNGEWNPDTIIKDVELRDLLNQVPLSCVVEVWLDTCYSGGMDRAFLDKPTHNRFLHNPNNTGKVMRLANSAMNHGLNSNIIMWCASSEAQESADAYIDGGSHGAFTWYWTQAFKANPKASRVDLLVATRKALAINGYDQFPRLKCWNASAQAQVGV